MTAVAVPETGERSLSAGTARATRYPCLDGARAVAALMVVVSHTAARSRVTAGGSFAAPYLYLLGNLGVAIFFVLSGFLLYRPYVAANLGGAPVPSIARYAWRRALRIFPAYWVALTAYLLVLSDRVTDSTNRLQLYGLAQVYSPNKVFAGIPAAWTLCVEISFYAFLPVLALLIHVVVRGRASIVTRLGVEIVTVAALACTGIAFRWFMLTTSPHRYPTLQWLPSMIDWFAIGMALAVASAWQRRGGEVPRPLAWLSRAPAVSWLIGLELLWVTVQLKLPTSFSPADPGDRMTHSLLFGLIGLVVVTPLVFGPQHRGWLRAALRSAPLHWVGVCSYSVYLWHQLVLRKMDGWLFGQGAHHPFWPLLLATVAGTVGVASLSYLLVERPALRLKDVSLRSLAARTVPLPQSAAP